MATKQADVPFSYAPPVKHLGGPPIASNTRQVCELFAQLNVQERKFMLGCFVAEVCVFSARGPDTETTMSINENTVLVFENVDLNVCGGYDSSTGKVMLYYKHFDLNVYIAPY